jgi:hypothetical protein
VNSLVALVLPAYLTHHIPATTYGAWILILQLGAYVSFLDLVFRREWPSSSPNMMHGETKPELDAMPALD